MGHFGPAGVGHFPPASYGHFNPVRVVYYVRRFQSVTKKDAILIFQNVDEARTKELVEILPYFPYMAKIEYHNLDKQF